jgi:hypothetical protein
MGEEYEEEELEGLTRLPRVEEDVEEFATDGGLWQVEEEEWAARFPQDEITRYEGPGQAAENTLAAEPARLRVGERPFFMGRVRQDRRDLVERARRSM